MRAYIRVGDPTSHGGVVVGGIANHSLEGMPFARVGDSVTCPTHGANAIVSGDTDTLIDGRPAAREGDLCACGAALIATQRDTGTE